MPRAASTATTQTPVQGSSRPQPAATVEQVHTAFKYALAGLSSKGTGTTAQSSTEVQSSGIQQASSAYAQVEQQAGQALDITV